MTNERAESILGEHWPEFSGDAEFEDGVYRVFLTPLVTEAHHAANAADSTRTGSSAVSFWHAIQDLALKVTPRLPLPTAPH